MTNRISRGPSDTRVRKSHTATRLLDGRILFAGGEYLDKSSSIYDPVAGTVVTTGSMNVGRQRHTNGEIEIWVTDHTDHFVSFGTFMADPDFIIAAADDFDGDGRGDVLWRHLARGENYIGFMEGDAVRHTQYVARAGHTTPVTDMNYSVAGTGDFDGAGKSDIFWRNPTTGENAVTLFDGYNAKAMSSLPAVSEAGWITPNRGGHPQ